MGITNEEAIQILKQYLDMDSEVKSEYLEAQRMAIKALEDKGYEQGYKDGYVKGFEEGVVLGCLRKKQ